MAWEENPRICLHMQLIAILSRTGVLKGTADDTDIDNSGMGRINTKGLNNY